MKVAFAQKLRELRIEAGYSQEKLAEVFHVGRATIGHWETGLQQPSLEVIADIAKFFNVSTDYLLGLTD